MSSKKTIVVVGATGIQGGSVARTFLESSRWNVRALTRRPGAPAAIALAAQGAEVVQADLIDPASLRSAFNNAHAIFLNTDFWSFYRPLQAALEAEGKDVEPASQTAFEAETTCGKNAVDAAATVPTLERFVYSALGPIAKTSGGRYTKSLHFEAKAWVVDYIEQEVPVLAEKTSFIYVGGYNENRLLMPHLNPARGEYVFTLPMARNTRLPMIDAKESVGPFVHALITSEPPATKLLAYDSILTTAEMVEAWSKASGKRALLVSVSTKMMHEQMKVSREMLDSLDYIAEFGYTGGVKGVIEPHQLKLPVQTKSFEDWLAGRDWKKVLATMDG